MKPSLVTFDVFGTVLDWRRGLEAACGAVGRALGAGEFDRIVDVQGRLERGPFRNYASIVGESLVEVLGLEAEAAAAIGRDVGSWAPFGDAAVIRRLQAIAPCCAMTNSDVAHGAAVRRSLGFELDGWICAEEIRRYKPDPEFWRETARRMATALDARWWHVSAYADYDLDVAAALGLTTVLVRRPHCRAGMATHVVDDLSELARLLA